MIDLLQKLAAVERLAQGSRWQRLLNAPGKYLFAMGFREFFYSRSHRARPARLPRFWGGPCG